MISKIPILGVVYATITHTERSSLRSSTLSCLGYSSLTTSTYLPAFHVHFDVQKINSFFSQVPSSINMHLMIQSFLEKSLRLGYVVQLTMYKDNLSADRSPCAEQ